MGNITDERAIEVKEYFNAHGLEATALQFNLKYESVARYIRAVKELKPNPKVLIFDIETSPILSYVWGVWKQNIYYEQILSDWMCLCWAAKWLFDDKTMSDVLTPGEVAKEDDSRIMKSIWELVNEADVIIAHNGDKFDIPRLNTRFLLHGLKPPMPYQSIDTLKVIKKNFSFTMNRLDYVNKLLGLDRKIKTDFHLWKKCMRGDGEALLEMQEYNIQDVGILEELYVKIRPWVKSHPNMNLYVETNEERCPTCGNTNIDWGGFYHTAVGKYSTFRCLDCGSIGRSRVTSLSKDKRKSLTAPIAR